MVYSSLLPCDVHGLSVSTRAGSGTAQDRWGTRTAPACQHSSEAQGLRHTGSAKVPGLFELLPKAMCARGNLLCRTMLDRLVQGRVKASWVGSTALPRGLPIPRELGQTAAAAAAWEHFLCSQRGQSCLASAESLCQGPELAAGSPGQCHWGSEGGLL